MYLQRSEIRFSHDSIGRTFGRSTSHPYKQIGETLDDIITGKINVNSIPTISVYKKDGQWFTVHNRRLWVLQEAEKRGKCSEIYVKETTFINSNKFTTVNNGISVFVRGNPGGYLWQTMPITKIQSDEPPKNASLPPTKHPVSTSSFNSQKYSRKIDTDEICAKTSERSGPTFHESINSKSEECVFFRQKVSKDFDEMSVDTRNPYRCDVDSDFKNIDNDDDDEISDFSSGLESSQQNDIACALCQQFDTAEPNEYEIKGKTTKEKVVEKTKKTDIELAVLNGPNISGIHDNNTLLRSNSETPRQFENRNTAVTVLGMIYGGSQELSVYRSFHCRSYFGFFVIVFFIVSLAWIISQTTS